MMRRRRHGTARKFAAVAAGLAITAVTLTVPAVATAAAPPSTPAPAPASEGEATAPSLPAPPIPVVRPTQPSKLRALPPKTTTNAGPLAQPNAAAATAVPSPKTFGSGAKKTLVLYDTTSEYGWLGELYALGAGTLASHFGTVTAQPVVSYATGQLSQYSAVIYVGSTYNEPVPAAFLADVRAGTTPVIWAGGNVWQLADQASNAAFQQKYGWDPATSYYDTVDRFTSVSYNSVALTRSALNSGLLAPRITNAAAVTVLGTAACTDTAGAGKACDGIAQVPAGSSSIPWAIRSANLTFVSEIPLSYITESDRYLAFADLLFPALDPTAVTARRAMVRLEDVNPGSSDPAQLRQIADYLKAQNVPFSVAVIPSYRDPLGVENGGVNTSLDISMTTNTKVKAFNDALKYMVTRGATLIQHGTTHQYESLKNPYNAVSADDFEFYKAYCSTTPGGPVDPTGCPATDYVIQTGPVPNDSTPWAKARVTTGKNMFAAAGLPTPTIFETPHYSGSPASYAGMQQVYGTRYEREQFFAGQLSGAPYNYSRLFGQFFPYTVNDVYGTRVLPESLGNYEPDAYGNNPPRLPVDIVNNAKAEFAVRRGVASFFYHPYFGLTALTQTVQGIKGLGYTFVSPATLAAQP